MLSIQITAPELSLELINERLEPFYKSIRLYYEFIELERIVPYYIELYRVPLHQCLPNIEHKITFIMSSLGSYSDTKPLCIAPFVPRNLFKHYIPPSNKHYNRHIQSNHHDRHRRRSR